MTATATTTATEGPPPGTGVSTLGHVRLRDEATNEIILIPSPSDDPKDPLNWQAITSPES